MNTMQFYNEIGGNYEEIMSRLGSEAMVKRFVLKFANDPSFSLLTKGFEENDADTAFRAAHTLKGVCLNLGFDRLFVPANAMTEDLRGRAFTGKSNELYRALEKEYNVLIAAISDLE